jgi:hypothetical protein
VSESVGLQTALDPDRYSAILQKMEQMTELLRAMQLMMETQIGYLASGMEILEAKTDANQDMLAKMEAKMNANQEKRAANLGATQLIGTEEKTWRWV